MPKVFEIYRDTINIKAQFGFNSQINTNTNTKTNDLDKKNSSNLQNTSEDDKTFSFKPKDSLDISGKNNAETENATNEIKNQNELTDAEKKLVNQYKSIDRKVRAHEAAHRSAGAGLVRGGTNFTYEVAPDGKRYAVAGEVKIDISYDLDDPQATIRKMQQVRRAALAPADPSPQDRAVAAKAARIEAMARRELQKQQKDDNSNNIINKVYQKNAINIADYIGAFVNNIF